MTVVAHLVEDRVAFLIDRPSKGVLEYFIVVDWFSTSFAGLPQPVTVGPVCVKLDSS